MFFHSTCINYERFYVALQPLTNKYCNENFQVKTSLSVNITFYMLHYSER